MDLFLFLKSHVCSPGVLLSLSFLLLLSQTAEGEENEFKGCMEVSEMRRKEMDGSLKPEPLLIENPGRFVLFPIQDNEVRDGDMRGIFKPATAVVVATIACIPFLIL